MSRNLGRGWREGKVIEASSQGRTVKDYGICSGCKSFRCIKREYGEEQVWCDEADMIADKVLLIRPSMQDKVTHCDMFYPRGQMSLMEMSQIATFIEVEKGRKAGFRFEEEVKKIRFVGPDDEKEEEGSEAY